MDALGTWQPLLEWWQLLSLNTQIIVIAWALILAVTIAAPFELFTRTFLRLAEGYWPNGVLARWFSERRCAHHKSVIQRSLEQFSEMRLRLDEGKLTQQEKRRYQQMEVLLHNYPPNPERALPTMLGNIICAAEDHVRERYGLDLTVTWIRLYPAADGVMREAIEESRTVLDFLIRLIAQLMCFTIAALLLEWAIGQWWKGVAVFAVAVLIGFLVYGEAVQVAKSYSELVRAMYDLYRFQLYQSLHLPLPTANGDIERQEGEVLTQFLWRGDVEVQYSRNRRHANSRSC